MKKLLVYNDAGVDLTGFKTTINAVQTYGWEAEAVSASQLENSRWEEYTGTLIIPGGSSRYYHQKLQHLSQRIRDFISSGGAYFGICGGAYYASESVIFAEGTENEIRASHTLKLLPGITRGPVFNCDKFSYGSGENGDEVSAEGSLIVNLIWDNNIIRQKSSASYFNGGCIFENIPGDVTVIGKYADLEGEPPAALFFKYGRGNVLLVGFHPEFLLPDLNDGAAGRKSLMQNLLRLVVK